MVFLWPDALAAFKAASQGMVTGKEAALWVGSANSVS